MMGLKFISVIAFQLLYVAINVDSHIHRQVAFQLETAWIGCINVNASHRLLHGVDWYFRNLTNSKDNLVVGNGQPVNGFAKRFYFNTTDYSLRISPAMSTDTGIYVCLDNTEGRYVNEYQPVRLEVYDLLIPTTRSDIAVCVGDDVKLSCPVDSEYATAISWIRQRVPGERHFVIYSSGLIINGFTDRFRVESNSDQHRDLTIQNIEPDDGGVYECYNPVDTRQKSAVHVRIYAANSDSNKPIKLRAATSGEAVSLPCSTSPGAAPVSWWYQLQAGSALQLISHDGSVSTTYGARFMLRQTETGDYSLTLRKAMEKDSGLYTCFEELSNGQAQRTRIQLDIVAAAERIPTADVAVKESRNDGVLVTVLVAMFTAIGIVFVICCSCCRHS